jgi:hypothetical protein
MFAHYLRSSAMLVRNFAGLAVVAGFSIAGTLPVASGPARRKVSTDRDDESILHESQERTSTDTAVLKFIPCWVETIKSSAS